MKLLYRFHIVIYNVGVNLGDNVEGGRVHLHVGNEGLHRCAGAKPSYGADGLCEMLGAAVGKVVAGRAGQHHMAKSQLFCRLCDVFRLVFVGRQRPSRGYVAEFAVSRADVAENHKCGGVFFITFPEIGAVGFLADGVKSHVAHDFGDLGHRLLVISHLEPIGFSFHNINPYRF